MFFCLLCPLEALGASAQFEMTFGNAQINLTVEAHSGLSSHLVSLQGKREFLLIHGRRRQKGCIDTLEKPVWRRICAHDGFSGLRRMRGP